MVCVLEKLLCEDLQKLINSTKERERKAGGEERDGQYAKRQHGTDRETEHVTDRNREKEIEKVCETDKERERQ